MEDDGVRFTDVELQKRIDDEMKQLINKYSIKYTTLTGSVEDRLNTILKLI